MRIGAAPGTDLRVEAHDLTNFTLLAGAAHADITPESPQWLDGFGNRTTPSEGAYLPIAVRALALRQGDTSALILSAEVLAFDADCTGALKARVAAATGVPEAAIVFGATHTHCAPRVCGMVMPGVVDPEYVQKFEAACVDVATRAVAAREPAVVTASRGSDDTLGVNRRVVTESGVVMLPNRAGPHDRDVDTLWFAKPNDPDGPLLASLTVVACHPTSRGGSLIGGDYPGFLMNEVERRAGGVALFLLGAAGDVRPCFLNETGNFRQASVEEVQEAGERLATVALKGRSAARRIDAEPLRVARLQVEAPLEASPDREEWERLSADDANPLPREWATRMLARDPLPHVPFELQAVRLGNDLTLLCWPGEIASEYALWAKNALEAETTTGVQPRLLTAAYCNGAVGYVSTRGMYAHGGYEVRGSHVYYNLPAPYAPEVDELLRDATRTLFERLK